MRSWDYARRSRITAIVSGIISAFGFARVGPLPWSWMFTAPALRFRSPMTRVEKSDGQSLVFTMRLGRMNISAGRTPQRSRRSITFLFSSTILS